MKIIISLTLLLMTYISYAQDMTNQKLQQLIEKSSDSLLEGSVKGYWQFVKNDRLMLCVTDSTANRMRIVSPITEVSNLETKHLTDALVANYHTALDVKYAISNGVIWSVFIHRLKELSDDQFSDAILQVYRANKTFGTVYQSTDLFFAPGLSNGNNKEKVDSLEVEKKEIKRI